MVMNRAQFEFQFEIKPMKKQAVPRKVSICFSVIISHCKNKPRGSGFSVLLQVTDKQVFIPVN